MLHFYCTTAVGMGLIPGQGTNSPYDKQHRGEKKGGGHVVKVLERIYRLLLSPSVSNTSAVLCLVAQSCPTLCDPMDCSLPGSSVHGDSPSKNTGVGCHALLQVQSLDWEDSLEKGMTAHSTILTWMVEYVYV